jgi:hypothetical protein
LRTLTPDLAQQYAESRSERTLLRDIRLLETMHLIVR